ncbi:MAG: ribbon-helix-helix domain-containing protein [Candidatus Aminicenantes bacterium]|nr:ribbon-helix-helix domain-containing protein [Candidatus Aminicenantes bacterium]TFG52801.1 MAG: CopG family transcriptional regulator [Candidatus Aminicenantes bacterium]
MGNTIKFTISVSTEEFNELEAIRRKAGKTRSQFVREAVRAWEGGKLERSISVPKAIAGVKEDSARYGAPTPALPEFTDMAELRRRAIAAAGRFRSGVSDLSSAHDRYLEDGFAIVKESGPASGPDSGEKL